MAQQVVLGASIKCSFGVAPSSLIVTSQSTVLSSKMPCATIMDFAPITNIPPFGMCSAPTNPAVIAATSAAMGVFTPAPCVPATAAPWTPGSSTVMVSKLPALNNTSTCMCTWAGVVTVVSPGQTTEMIP